MGDVGGGHLVLTVLAVCSYLSNLQCTKTQICPAVWGEVFASGLLLLRSLCSLILIASFNPVLFRLYTCWLKGGFLQEDQLYFCFTFWTSADTLFEESALQSAKKSLKATNLDPLLLFIASLFGVASSTCSQHTGGILQGLPWFSVLFIFSLADFLL